MENQGLNDVWIFIIDANGNLKTQNSIGGTNIDYASEAIETTDNKIVVVGNSESNDIDIPNNQGTKDVLMITLK